MRRTPGEYSKVETSEIQASAQLFTNRVAAFSRTLFGKDAEGQQFALRGKEAALDAATMIWAQDLANTGVTVNSLIPGGAVDFEPGVRQHRPGICTLQPPEVMNIPWSFGWRRTCPTLRLRQLCGKALESGPASQ